MRENEMNAKNTTTGIVHNATIQRGFLLQTCGRTNTLVALTETTEEITCKRCSRKAPAKVEAPKAKVSAAAAKVLKVLAGGEWTNWRALGVGASTLNNMVKAGLIEADADQINYRAV